jgi:hypothetical protein
MPTDPSIIELSREEFYQKVWTTPMVHLAKELGTRSMILSNICVRYQIPKPSSGYWVKKQLGKASPQSELPPISDPGMQTIKISSHPRVIEEEEPIPQEFQKLIEAEKKPENEIIPVKRLSSSHTWVSVTQQVLHQQEPGLHNLLYLPFRGAECCLDVAVSRSGIPRAMRILDTLMKAFKKREFPVTIVPGDRCHLTRVTILGETLSIKLREKTNRVERELTFEEIHQGKTINMVWDRWKYIPTGRFELQASRSFSKDLFWRDNEDLLLEDKMNVILVDLIKLAGKKRTWQIEYERREIIRKEEECRRNEEEKRRQEERERYEALLKNVDWWHRSQQIRAYIQAVSDVEIQKTGQIHPGSDVDRWINWATRQADRLDPLM